jgi:hypothetical protein
MSGAGASHATSGAGASQARAGPTTALLGPPTRIYMDGHGGPAPACSRSHEPTAARLRTVLGRPQLHTAGPNDPDRDMRLDLLGRAAFGSGPGRSKESDRGGRIRDGAGRRRWLRRAGSGRAAPIKIYRMGTWRD